MTGTGGQKKTTGTSGFFKLPTQKSIERLMPVCIIFTLCGLVMMLAFEGLSVAALVVFALGLVVIVAMARVAGGLR